MKEIILTIDEITEKGVEGYEVVTNKQNIRLLIDNSQRCCENWGYFWCNDNPQDFVFANLLSVTLTDDALNEAKLKESGAAKLYQGGIMFVDLKTDRGTLQFVAYNEHNGYYSHEAKVVSNQLTHNEYL